MHKSTRQTDPVKAQEQAEIIYANVVLGRQHAHQLVSVDFEKAVAGFLADYELHVAPGTFETAALYFRADLIPFFGSFDRFTAHGYDDYVGKRMKEVTRSTVRKELSVLRQFCEWCTKHGVSGLPPIPSLKKRGFPGTRAKNARKHTGLALAPAEIAKLLFAMPDRSPRTGTFVRPFFTVLWETGLRPFSTVAKLEAPLHYRKGSETLFISRDIDKEEYERLIPLTPEAREALDRVCPEEGKLFPEADGDALRESLEAAKRASGLESNFSIYDFRHSRITHLANSPGVALTGIAFLVGHKHVSTTARYIHADSKAAQAALDAVAKPSRGKGGARGTRSGTR